MALKILSFIFAISLALGFPVSTQSKDVPFDVNEVINRVSNHHSQPPNPPSRVSDEGRFDQPLIPDLTGEFLIDTSIVYVGAPNDQNSPAVAFDGTNYLVVWQDERSGSSHIYGARVNQAGQVLDPTGIAISTTAGQQYSPSVAFDGTNYLVVWRNGGGSSADIYGARVNQAGLVLDPNGIRISTTVCREYAPSVAFDGINYLVVWESDYNGEYDIRGARVDCNGFVLDTNAINISNLPGDQKEPSLAWDDTNYLVVWKDESNDDIYCARVSPAGFVLDTAGIAISTAERSQSKPCVAFGEMDYLVVWRDSRAGFFRSDIYGARVKRNGSVIDPNGIPISVLSYGEDEPSIVFDGINYLIAWECLSKIYGARVRSDGVVIDTNAFRITFAPGRKLYPSVAFDRTNYFVVWEDRRGGRDIYGSRVNRSGLVLDSAGITISTANYNQYSPSAAFDGTNYLVVWEDGRNGDYSQIYGARVSETGCILDPNGIRISTAGSTAKSPAIAFDGTNYLVVWADKRNDTLQTLNYDIYGARVSPTGALLDTIGIAISTHESPQHSPSVTFDGLNHLVVWENYRAEFPDAPDIYGARVDGAGSVLDPNGIPISAAEFEQEVPAVVTGRNGSFVVWQDWRSDTTGIAIFGARVNQSGTVLDSLGILVSEAIEYDQYYPSVAFDGTNYLIVWQDWRNYPDLDIYGTRVSQAGVVLDTAGIRISTARDYQESPSIAFDGINYLVVWGDNRSGSSSDIYGATVSPSGALVDSFLISTQEGNQESPALANGSGNQVLITYQGWVGEYQGRAYDATRIWGKFYPFVGIEEENSKVKMQRAKLLEVYPNPAKTVMRVRYQSPFDSPFIKGGKGDLIKIFNVSGKLIKEIASATMLPRNDEKIEISLKGINPGIYFLQLGTEVKKFLVVK